MNRKNEKLTAIKKILNTPLFWDTNSIDIELHASYIICRILNFGNYNDIKVLRSIYNDSKIVEVIKSKRSILPKAAKYWALKFNIPMEDVKCLAKYYQKEQKKEYL